MNNITIDEVKDILKCSIDKTTNMNEAIERTLQHIYLKGWNDAEKEHNYHLDKMRTEIEALEYLNIEDGSDGYDKYIEQYEVLKIIDRYNAGKRG